MIDNDNGKHIYKKAKIFIHPTKYIGDVPIEILADCTRYLAVHKSIDNDKKWVVTHIPTGLGIYNDFKCKKKALAAMEYLLKYDWNFTTTEIHKDLPKLHYKQLCQGYLYVKKNFI
jgi:hypothetical protein